MTLIHETIKVRIGESVDLPVGVSLAGTHLEPDGSGGFLVVIHLLRPVDGLPVSNGEVKALPQ